MPVIYAAVEGLVDEAVVRKLIREAGADAGEVYGKRGKGHLRQKMGGTSTRRVTAVGLCSWTSTAIMSVLPR